MGKIIVSMFFVIWLFLTGFGIAAVDEDVTVREWRSLTSLEKSAFLSECLRDLEKETGGKISVNPTEYIKAMNYYAQTCPKDFQSGKVATVFRNILKDEGLVDREPEVAPPQDEESQVEENYYEKFFTQQ